MSPLPIPAWKWFLARVLTQMLAAHCKHRVTEDWPKQLPGTGIGENDGKQFSQSWHTTLFTPIDLQLFKYLWLSTIKPQRYLPDSGIHISRSFGCSCLDRDPKIHSSGQINTVWSLSKKEHQMLIHSQYMRSFPDDF
jgi:hypothetical protein